MGVAWECRAFEPGVAMLGFLGLGTGIGIGFWGLDNSVVVGRRDWMRVWEVVVAFLSKYISVQVRCVFCLVSGDLDMGTKFSIPKKGWSGCSW